MLDQQTPAALEQNMNNKGSSSTGATTNIPSPQISATGRIRAIPPEFETIQVDFCKTPGCENFGVPPFQGPILTGRSRTTDATPSSTPHRLRSPAENAAVQPSSKAIRRSSKNSPDRRRPPPLQARHAAIPRVLDRLASSASAPQPQARRASSVTPVAQPHPGHNHLTISA